MKWVKGIAMGSDATPAEDEENTLLELLDRLLNAGVVLCGDLVVSVADIELLYLRLQLTLSSVETARRAGVVCSQREFLQCPVGRSECVGFVEKRARHRSSF